ncbi:hypothetical protein WJX73_000314 [Symbiochloris irregularis]|uniref:Uncharacterized protein n=1 Tax=Symbiochloris irregularis TaxID=706552 RepID=A0AAW1P8U0_9CHLO
MPHGTTLPLHPGVHAHILGGGYDQYRAQEELIRAVYSGNQGRVATNFPAVARSVGLMDDASKATHNLLDLLVSKARGLQVLVFDGGVYEADRRRSQRHATWAARGVKIVQADLSSVQGKHDLLNSGQLQNMEAFIFLGGTAHWFEESG